MILIVTALFPPEPVVSAQISYDLAVRLSGNNKVIVLAPKPSRPYGYDYQKIRSFEGFLFNEAKSFTLSQSNIGGRIIESISFGFSIYRFIKLHNKNLTVVYANVWPIFSQLAVALACVRFKLPYVMHVQDVYPESLFAKKKWMNIFFGGLLKNIDGYVLKNSRKIIAISEGMKKYLIKTRFLNESSVKVIMNWQNDVSFSIFNSRKALPVKINRENFSFLYLGSISESAGVDVLINAFGLVSDKLSGAKLTIAGSGGAKNKCMNIAKKYNANIKFIDADPDKVPEIQSEADVLLLPLKKGIAATALPSKLTAYMFSGKPIIASVDENSDVAKIILNNKCGWVVKSESVDDLSKAMLNCARADKIFLKQCGENAIEYAKSNLTRSKNLEMMVELIKEGCE